jgi:hypothetical protein
MKKAAFVLVFAVFVSQSLQARYAQLALGGGYECVVILNNKLASEFKGGVDLRKGNGETWDTPFRVNGQSASDSSIEVTLPAFGSTRLLLQGEATARTGYLVVFGSGANTGSDVAVAFFYNFYSGGRLVDSVGVPPGSQSGRHMFAVEKTATVNTAFAWAPPWTPLPSFDITVTLYDSAGNQVQQKTIPFTGHLAKYFTEIFDAVPANFVGHVRVVSPQAIVMTVLRFETVGESFQLTSTPSDYFTP